MFTKYWSYYGGAKALVKSRFFIFSIVVTAILYRTWLGTEWWDDVFSVVPSILGFSLGGFAIFLAMGDDKFRQTISGGSQPNKPSPWLEVNASFVHFITVQVIALFAAILSANFIATDLSCFNSVVRDFLNVFKYIFRFIGYFLFIYSLALILATTFALFRTSTWYDMHVDSLNKQKDKN